jgi:hypothetical protein
MRSIRSISCLLAALGAFVFSTFAVNAAGASPSIPAARAPGKGRFVVHEWGTFLSVQGSNGVSVGGVVESEELLPKFVFARTDKRSWNRAFLRQKMETPVTYFYSDRPLEVKVRVDMPQGLLTHWFPAVRDTAPGQKGEKKDAGAGSFLDWGRFQILPDRAAGGSAARIHDLPRVGPDDPWRFARETDAALVRIHAGDPENLGRHDHEKFLFYRGLGTFELPVSVASQGSGAGLRLTLRNAGEHPIRGAVAIEVGKDRLRFAVLGELPANGSREVTARTALGAPRALDEGVAEVKKTLTGILAADGLFDREALAMVNTWERSYFRTPGLRLLYLLPRPAVDAAIPIRMEPAPDNLVRVMVARVELLTPEAEAAIEGLVAAIDLDADGADGAGNGAARAELARHGRLLEPALRRIAAATKLPAVARRADRMLAEIAKKPY